ncbi:hypothetical protein [Gemmiger qucibialis]|uniref:hypothetical protein n=1 Tax=Gemmiger qucibialis TaxID=2997294 RepID=UPI0022E02055|nr:hypothetical protein [Gemmiger qucibialis]
MRLKQRSGSCGTASAAPRSPYRHLELCGIALGVRREELGVGRRDKGCCEPNKSIAGNSQDRSLQIIMESYVGALITGSPKTPNSYFLTPNYALCTACAISRTKASMWGTAAGPYWAKSLMMALPTMAPSLTLTH